MDSVAKLRALLLSLLGVAFTAVATAAYNVIAPDPEQQLAFATIIFIALAAIAGIFYLATAYHPELLRRFRDLQDVPRDSRLSVPNAVTASRLLLCGPIALALFASQLSTAYWLYLAGLVTDLLDGMVARSVNGATDWGKRFDAQVDVLFNGVAGLSLFCFGLRNGSLPLTVSISLLFALFIVRLFWFPAGLLPKYFSGLVRLVYFVVFMFFLPRASQPAALYAGLGVLFFGAWYEYRVMVASSRLPSRVPEPPAAPTRRDA